jgi:hypothetical protein
VRGRVPGQLTRGARGRSLLTHRGGRRACVGLEGLWAGLHCNRSPSRSARRWLSAASMRAVQTGIELGLEVGVDLSRWDLPEHRQISIGNQFLDQLG